MVDTARFQKLMHDLVRDRLFFARLWRKRVLRYDGILNGVTCCVRLLKQTLCGQFHDASELRKSNSQRILSAGQHSFHNHSFIEFIIANSPPLPSASSATATIS